MPGERDVRSGAAKATSARTESRNLMSRMLSLRFGVTQNLTSMPTDRRSSNVALKSTSPVSTVVVVVGASMAPTPSVVPTFRSWSSTEIFSGWARLSAEVPDFAIVFVKSPMLSKNLPAMRACSSQLGNATFFTMTTKSDQAEDALLRRPSSPSSFGRPAACKVSPSARLWRLLDLLKMLSLVTPMDAVLVWVKNRSNFGGSDVKVTLTSAW